MKFKYQKTPRLVFPLKNFKTVALEFGKQGYADRKNWGKHLGLDLESKEGTQVFSCGRGVVVYSKVHPGEFDENDILQKRNWGGIVIIAHKNPKTQKIFYSLYGHMGKRYVKKGDEVEKEELIGEIGKSMSESNGGWEKEHLHLAIYTGRYEEQVLPGYYKREQKTTNPRDWEDPMVYIKKYNRSLLRIAKQRVL